MDMWSASRMFNKSVICAVSFMLLALVQLSIGENVNNSFIPTDSWQTVSEGQAIPAGLHVRINLQSGKKEAKLIKDSPKDKKDKSALIPVSKDAEDVLDVKKLKEALKMLKGDDGMPRVSSSANFRTYEEIKKDLEGANLIVKSDIEVLKGLMEEYINLTNGTSFDESTTPQCLAILIGLEYLVHQYDNAVEFAKLDGFTTIVIPTLNSTSSGDEIRAETLLLLGSAAQSNPRVQLSAIQAGCVGFLLKMLTSERDPVIRLRGLYALSCLVRSFPAAQSKLVNEGGITVLSDLFDDEKHSNEKIRRKILLLLTDLIIEAKNSAEPENAISMKEIYKQIGLEQVLRDQRWCQRIADWLCRQVRWKDVQKMGEDDVDHEAIEVAVDFMLPISTSCLEDFVTNIELHNVINHVKQFYNDLVLREMDEGVSDSFYADNMKKLRELAVTLARTTEFKDEL